MATTRPLPPQPQELARGAEAAETTEGATEDALVAQMRMEPPAESLALGPAVAVLPVELDVAIPVRGFRVKNLLALEPGSVIETQWSHGEDMPLKAGDVQLAWSEFEVVDAQLAVRVTRLA